jgi:phenylacetate-coenzyme A ligase PaaK-like adenylate-forming protein
MLEPFLNAPVYGLARAQKQALLGEAMRELTAHHRAACPPYDAILKAYGTAPPGGTDAPFLPVAMFKLHELASVPRDQVFKTMTSSGTTGQQPSRIFLDADTAKNQTRVLARIMTSFLGPKRLPMLIIDHPSVIKDRRSFSARGAGILGMMTFGRQHTFALKDETMELAWDAIDRLAETYRDQPILAFGFTFMAWRYLLQALERSGRTLPFRDAILIHSGGWKKLEAEKISNEVFKQRASALGGFSRVHNFYGMVEQTGSVFVECEAGRLHAPLFADVIVRDPLDWRECAIGEAGVIQVLSVLPRSYPGHSLLTEDRGVLLGEDDCPCGRMGRTFAVQGRIPKAEVRGCSDTFTAHG